MTFRKVELVGVFCDLCQSSGQAALRPEHAEQHAESVGITRFMGGAHVCGECRKVLAGEAVKPVAKAVGK